MDISKYLKLLLAFSLAFFLFSSSVFAQTSSTTTTTTTTSSPSPSPSSSPSPSPSPSESEPEPEAHSDFWSLVSDAIANPGGAINAFINMIVDSIASIFPSTPENLKIGSLINSIGDSMPAVGRGIVREIFVTISACISLVMIIKIYKLIPFKAT